MAETQQLLSKGPDEKFCSECGAVIRARAEICPHCGVRQPGMAGMVEGGRNKVVAALLALFLGGFGAHRFYLGQVGMGLVYLAFCWTFIPALVAFVECFIYLSMSDSAFAARYGKD